MTISKRRPRGAARARPGADSASTLVDLPYREPAHVVYRFGLHLRGTDPPIWRLIDVPGEYRFWDLHVAIQDAMGWLDYHLHEFSITAPDSESLSRLVATPDTGPPPVYRRSVAGRGKQLWRSQDYDVATDRRSPYVTEAPAR